MKNQYFADLRDFVKFDLLIELVERISGIRRLSNALAKLHRLGKRGDLAGG